MKAGDVVRLKTGSPLTTVEGINDNGTAAIVWFNLNSDLMQTVNRSVVNQELLEVIG